MLLNDARFVCTCLLAVTVVSSGQGEADDFMLYTAKAYTALPSELVCEGHDYSREKCESFGCCSFSENENECWSAKGSRPCESAGFDADSEPIQQSDNDDVALYAAVILVNLRQDVELQLEVEFSKPPVDSSLEQLFKRHQQHNELRYLDVFDFLGGKHVPKPFKKYKSEFSRLLEDQEGDDIKKVVLDLDDPGQYVKVENTTTRNARTYCAKRAGCLGFTYIGSPATSEDAFKRIFFKSSSDLGKTGWTTYIHKGMGSSLSPQTTKPPSRFRGSLKAVKSDPPPDKNSLYTGAILNIVGSTFKDVTQNLEKDVFVSCYAPWCGYCQQFKEPLGKLAKALHHVESLVIAQIDATSNEIEGLEIDSFPTIVFFPAGDRKDQPVKYIGNRQIPDMIHWLQKHATHGNFSEHQNTSAAEQSGLLGDDDDL